MKSIDNFPGYREAIQRKRHKQLIRQVTQILMNRLMIGDGDNLVGIIGSDIARTNNEAVRSWVESVIGYTETRSPDEVTRFLADELTRYLTTVNLYTNQYY